MADKKWALLRADGTVAGQVITNGATPTEAGDNPDGLEEVAVTKFGDLDLDTFDRATKTWKRDTAKAKRRARDARIASRAATALLEGEVEAAVIAGLTALAAILAPGRKLKPEEVGAMRKAIADAMDDPDNA
jgi:hypothetical protein